MPCTPVRRIGVALALALAMPAPVAAVEPSASEPSASEPLVEDPAAEDPALEDPAAEDPAAALSALVDAAIAANPGLAARRAMARQLSARAAVAGAWPDPAVGLEYSNVPVDSLGLADHPMAGLQVRIQQPLRPPAWSRQQRSVLEERAGAADAAVDEAALVLASQVEVTFWRLARARLLRRVTEAHLRRTEELLDAVRARYEVGAVGQSHLLRLRVLRDRLQDDIEDFDRAERELTAALSQALAADRAATFATPDAVDTRPPPAEADWLAIAEEHRPEIARLAAERRAADAAVSLARTDALPDPTVWAGYRLRTVQTDTDPGRDLVSVGISVPIPTGSGRRARGAVRGWQAAASGVDARREALVDDIVADMDAILARWRRAAAKATTYEQQLIPAAETTLAVTLADFTVGRADFSSLFDAEIALLDLERGRIDAVTTTWLQRAEALATLGIHPEDARP
ncbi:MAG: TolC family protein [Deltaproteobacteria bacterium]|nr:MAG: TolC family protein [Deltaproteobacteria bacterium]